VLGNHGKLWEISIHQFRNEEVGGSIPPGSTNLRRFAASVSPLRGFGWQANLRGSGLTYSMRAKRRRLRAEARMAKAGWID